MYGAVVVGDKSVKSRNKAPAGDGVVTGGHGCTKKTIRRRWAGIGYLRTHPRRSALWLASDSVDAERLLLLPPQALILPTAQAARPNFWNSR